MGIYETFFVDETTLTETNSSGIASKNSSSQNRTTTSSSSGQTRQSPLGWDFFTNFKIQTQLQINL